MQISVSKYAHSSKSWRTLGCSWEGLIDHLQRNTVITQETLAEYLALDKGAQGKIKNVGAFMGASMLPGSTDRKLTNVKDAQILVLDADTVQPDLLDKLDQSGLSYILYSTHSSTPVAPKYRVIFDLTRPITLEEHMHVAHRIAQDFGVENFCNCSYRINQEMFYPSYPRDVTPIFKHVRGRPIDVDLQVSRDVDEDLFKATDGSKVTTLPGGKKLGDPRDYDGIVGAFCRKYTITECITKFLSLKYEPTDDPNRWAVVGGTSAGLVIYDDLWAYSHHATHDPASDGHCHNAFNLFKVHGFAGDFVATAQFISEQLPDVMAEAAKKAFDEQVAIDAETHGDWTRLLDRSDMGNIRPTLGNCLIIMSNDRGLSGIAFDSFKNEIVVREDLPWRTASKSYQWRDPDDSELYIYISLEYCDFSKRDLDACFIKTWSSRAFNPLIEMLDELPEWDGEERVDTLFIDCLGAEDTRLTRLITRKWIAGCIQRAYKPGLKQDHMLMLIGEQGIQKSTMLAKLAMSPDFFTDSVGVRDMEDGKRAGEKIQGIWIAELGEMKGMLAADKEAVKNFLSSQSDHFRPSYGRVARTFPRICCFAGTTNRSEQLTDETGNRRYWIIKVEKYVKSPEVDQVWAEAKARFMSEPLYLDSKDEQIASNFRKEFVESDVWVDQIDEWIKKNNFTETTVKQVWTECFNFGIKECEKRDQMRIARALRMLSGKEPKWSRIGKVYSF
jgi:predicted P-loop ATPase